MTFAANGMTFAFIPPGIDSIAPGDIVLAKPLVSDELWCVLQPLLLPNAGAFAIPAARYHPAAIGDREKLDRPMPFVAHISCAISDFF
jgi:hypothetical protein